MSGNGYKALGFLVWRGGMWYLRRRRYGVAKRARRGLLAAGAVAAAGAVVLAQRRNGAH